MIGNGWDRILLDEKGLELINKPFKAVEKLYKEKDIYPSFENIFKAFKLTSFDDTKVVIIGQDPYHTKGMADGLAFSVSSNTKKAPSLKNIFKELENEFDTHIDVNNVGDLSNWAKQGVLLLNNTLTVESGKPNSHIKLGWSLFTDYIVEKLNEKEEPIIFILWGNLAQRKCDAISDRHYILKTSHPSPFSARSGFFGCDHFKLANEFLVKNGKKPIDWVNLTI